MLTKIELRSFKCFELLRLPLAPLTLLTGFNASGKSSVLQALGLLHQTMSGAEFSTRLLLNGSAVQLGTLADVVDQLSGNRDEFEIGVEDDTIPVHPHLVSSCAWTFGGDRRDMSISVRRVVAGDSQAVESPEDLRYLIPRITASYPGNLPEGGYPTFLDINDRNRLVSAIRFLTYVTAERAAPQDIYRIEDPLVVRNVGSQGEHTVSVLQERRDDSVPGRLALPDAPPTMLRQVEERMRTIFPGFRMDLRQVQGVNAVTLGLRTSDATDFHSPVHTGFGLTQVLPIVVAALSAREGELIMVENPEVHLHPAGQALMGEFLAEVANAGIQVLVETHSDHVLNGVRRAVKEKELAADKVAIHFFRPRSDELPQALSLNMDDSGNIDDWPEGFFDQFDKDANYFAGWGEDWA